MLSRHRSPLLAAVALVLVAPVPGVGHAQPPSAAPAQPADLKPRTVTLITGDTVELRQRAGRQAVQVRPGVGRKKIRFMVSQDRDHVYVLPSDAMALTGRGVVDRRLFNVTALLGYGYDDAKRRDLPLLIQGRSSGSVASLADDGGGQVTRKLTAVNAVAVRQPKKSTGRLWTEITDGARLRSGVTRIWLDGSP